MKSILPLSRIVIAGLLLAPMFANAAQDLQPLLVNYPPAPVEMELKQVSEHVYYVQGAAGTALDNEGFISNAGFVVTRAGVVVIDALGTPSLAAMLLRQIRTVTDQPVVKVICTHYHADHIYGLQVFKEAGAEIIAPAGANEYLNSPAASERLEERRFSLDPWVNEKTHLVAPDVGLKKSTRFELGGMQFVLTLVGKAHSDGDLTVYVEPDRVLFSGDIIFEGRVAYLGDANTKHWLDVLQQMETSRLVALIPGHGPAASDPNQAIRVTRRYLAYIRKVMGEAVLEMDAFDEAYAQADWSEFKDLPAFEAANRRNAYQVYLSLEEELLGQ
ncbi:MAG: MBL fold metallo-hydrolase [Proteobacteria bacterium]|jgi:glyoxylase-like metal-dependent hydrolase (beta-lactamase superfamily II)|nr:MBL fold metallo-hydrolase [Pseudomonadota bacterium]MCG6935568.1 MBL fold metallo-hydrolase [Pseudomonadota bacterium]